MQRRILLRALCLTCVLWTLPAATTMFELGLADLSTGSAKIVQARVTAVVPQWSPDSGAIFTYVRMNIVDDLIGADEDNEIIIKQVGGKVGTVEMHVEGASLYKAGEESVIFLFPDVQNPSTWQTLGMFQGRYRIYTGSDGAARVSRDSSGEATLLRKSALGTVETGNTLPLADFKARVIEYRNAVGN